MSYKLFKDINTTDLSIIIINFNSANCLRTCLLSIFKYTDGINFEVIVVDNNSSEQGINKIQDDFKKIKLITRKINDGFAVANNFGAKYACGDYLLFLNPDTLIIDNSIEAMLNCIRNISKCGILSPLLLNPDGTLQYCHNKFHNLSFFFKEAFHLHYKNINKVIKSDYSRINVKLFEIDWALGAALMIKRDLFFKLGGFDERYFMYYEDGDFALKVKHNGYRNYCLPAAKVVHLGGQSLNSTKNIEDKEFSHHQIHKSRLVYIAKNFNLFETTLVRFIFILSYLFKIPFVFFKKQNGYKTKKENISFHLSQMKLYFYSRKFVLTKKFIHEK